MHYRAPGSAMSEPRSNPAWRPTPTSPLGRCVHACRHPALVALFLAGFALTVVSLPRRPPDDSWVVGWVSRQYRAAESLATGSRPKPVVNIGPRRDFAWVYLRITDGVAFATPLEEFSWDEQSALQDRYPGSLFVRVGYVHEVHRRGFWFPWRERWLVTVVPQDLFAPHTQLDVRSRDAALQAASLHVRDTNARVARAILTQGDSGHCVLWGRVALNACSLALLALGLHGVWKHRHWRRQRRWLTGMCPVCCYPLVGVPAPAGLRTCPECGVTAPEAASTRTP